MRCAAASGPLAKFELTSSMFEDQQMRCDMLQFHGCWIPLARLGVLVMLHKTKIFVSDLQTIRKHSVSPSSHHEIYREKASKHEVRLAGLGHSA